MLFLMWLAVSALIIYAGGWTFAMVAFCLGWGLVLGVLAAG